MKILVVDDHALTKPYAEWANFGDVAGKHIGLAILEIERTSF
jgi:hypothetical protein